MVYSKEQATENLRIIREEAGGKCVDCGSVENLHFHHLQDKKFEVSDCYRSLSQLREEASKCVLLIS